MILALDTATRLISLALHDGEQLIAEATWRTTNHHTAELAPALDGMMRRAAVGLADLSAIAVASGPGSYTGLRIGLAIAKGLALSAAQPLPLIGIPTLDIAAAGQPHLADRLYVVAQAGRGRLSAGLYAWQNHEWVRRGEPFITSWASLVEQLTVPTQIGGEIDPVGRALLAQHGCAILTGVAHTLRRAGYLAELAYHRLNKGEVSDPALLAPRYLG